MPLLPDIIEEISYDALKSDTLNYLSTKTGLDVSFLESDQVMLIIEAFLYREMLMRARNNDIARASYLFTATGSDLDTKAYDYGVTRLEGESDDILRERCVLSLSRLSTAGARDTYIYWAKTVSSQIKEVNILTPAPGTVEIVYHADSDFTAEILEICSSDDVRPLTDQVLVTKANIVNTEITLSIEILEGYSIIDIRNNVTQAFASLSFGIGDDIPLSKILATAQDIAGVYKVTETSNNGDRIANEREVIQPIIHFN